MALQDWPSRSIPSDLDRERIEREADHATMVVRRSLDSLLHCHELRPLAGIAVQRLYIRRVLRNVVRMLLERLRPDDMLACARHVEAQDGPMVAPLLPDRGVAVILRTLATLAAESGR
jgi:hypothetical protein